MPRTSGRAWSVRHKTVALRGFDMGSGGASIPVGLRLTGSPDLHKSGRPALEWVDRADDGKAVEKRIVMRLLSISPARSHWSGGLH